MKKIYILGDSHAHQLSIAYRMCKMRDFADAGFDVEFRLFGAVKQGVNPHHALEGREIRLLEENWEQKVLPVSPDDLDNPDVTYLLSLPFNITPLLRMFDFKTQTTIPGDRQRQFLSDALVSELVVRRSGLGVALAKDMHAIGMRTVVVSSPHPFANNTFSRFNRATLERLITRFFTQTEQALNEVGVPVIAQPERTLISDGIFTRAGFNSGDQQHATRDYYTDMLRHILSQIQAMNP